MYQIEQTDCFEWLRQCPGHSVHAVCTDPPYGILEFNEKELAKLRAGRAGVWRLQPKLGGSHKGCYEPWMLFRKPIATTTGAENLRRWRTGALRRLSTDKPLPDAIPSGRTPKREEAISNHPCLKPHHFMRIIVRALLPLG